MIMRKALRLVLPHRRQHITQKIKIAGRRTLYISVHDDLSPAEIFLRVKGEGCTAEVVALFDVLARLASLALQFGAPLKKVADMLHGVQLLCESLGHSRDLHGVRPVCSCWAGRRCGSLISIPVRT